jgi:tetratricopeptide (TPR) repeat protein
LDQADELVLSGENEKALVLYREWLDTSTDSPDFFTILQKTIQVSGSSAEIIELTESYGNFITDPSDKNMLYKNSAEVAELSGRFEPAQKFYETAFLSDPQQKDYISLLNSAALLLETGDLEKGEFQARLVMNTASGSSAKPRAVLLLSRLLYWQGKISDAAVLLENYIDSEDGESSTDFDSLARYYLYQIKILADEDEDAKRISEELIADYPGRLETMLLESSISSKAIAQIQPFPSPTMFLKEIPIETVGSSGKDNPGSSRDSEPQPADQPDRKGYIQTGSFSVHENAEYMAEDLRREGFDVIIEPVIIQSRTYHKVIIPIKDVPPAALRSNSQEVQKYLITLKEKGFEGFFYSD